MMFYFLVCWKLLFYMLLMSVDLPEDVIVIKRQVSYTDVYYPHILAEMVFVSDHGYDNIKEAILAENGIIMRKNVFMDGHIMSRAGVDEWDDACSDINLAKSSSYCGDFRRDAHCFGP